MKPGGFPERIWTSRAARAAFLAAALLLLATVTRPGPLSVSAGAEVAQLTISPVALDADDPRRRRAGGLVFLGGWSLASENRHFGGISAIHVERGLVTAISDAGTLLRFAIPGRGRAQVRIDRLPGGPTSGARKIDRDAEAMLVRGDAAWIGFEQQNMIRRYRLPGWRAESSAPPPAMRDWSANAGPEAMVRLADGRFLVFAEGRNDGRAHSDALLFEGDPAIAGTPATRLRYRREPGFRISDAALLPDGRLLLLNRRFGVLEGWSARLAVASSGGLVAGATIEGRAIADLRSPLITDNMEALSVTVEGGRTIVWIASDDNFIALQRTLLLKFALTQ